MRKLSRRRALGGAVLLGAGAPILTSLSACGDDNGGGNGGGGGGPIRFAWWGNPERDERTTNAVDAFTTASDQQVEVEPTTWDDYWTQLATQMTANPPDLIQMDYQFIAEYANAGRLLELDDYVPDPLDVSDVPDDALESGRIEGALYGLTMGFNTFAMLKNLRVIQEAGADDPDHTITWEDFADLCIQIGQNTPDGVFGAENAYVAKEPMECWLHQRGKALYTADGGLGFEPADLEEWWTYWVELVEQGGAVDFETAAESLDDLSDWEVPSGRGAFNFHWSNIVPAFVEVSEDEVGVTMYPQGAQPGQYYKASMLLSIPSQSGNPDAAADLMRALVLDPEVAQELGFERGVPSSEGVREQLLSDASDPELTSLEYVEFVEDKIRAVPPPPPEAGGEVEDEFVFYGEQVGFGESSIPDAVDAFFQSATSILA